MTRTCCLCSQIRGERSGDLLSELLDHDGQYRSRVLFRSESLVTIPSLGGLGEAHLLVCTTEHVRRFVSASITHERLQSYVGNVVAELLRLTESTSIHMFEHGNAAKGSRVVCTVDHAHLHLVASDAEVWARLRPRANWVSVSGPQEIKELVGLSEYLYYRDPSGRSYCAVPRLGEVFESQLIRKAFADAEGNPARWNWRDEPRAAEADSLLNQLESRLEPALRGRV